MQDLELDELIPRLGHKVGGGDAHISGGQRQRVALARALLRQPQVLLVDEPSSGLDEESEQGMIRVLRRCAHSAIVLTAAHRPLMIAASDVVISLDDEPDGASRSNRGQAG